MNYKNITFIELKDLLNNNTVLIDVRSPEEWENYNLTNSINLPLSNIDVNSIITICDKLCRENTITKDEVVNLVFYCRSGVRSIQTIYNLLEDEDMKDNVLLIQGYKFIIYNLKGGISSLSLYT